MYLLYVARLQYAARGLSRPTPPPQLQAGSSTLGSILWRYAVKNGLRLFPESTVSGSE